jgi:hypothetical protein
MGFEQLPKLELFFKGFPEDVRFRRHTVPESLEIARGSLYEAWYRCVKLSPYLADAIDTDVWRSDRLRTTYKNFGDLRNTTFDEWWLSMGFGLFSEGKDFRRISVCEISEDLDGDTIRFLIPLTTSPATLKKQFDALLKKHHPYYKKFDRWEHNSTATARMRTSKLKSDLINKYIQAYETRQELRKSNPSVRLYEVGEAMNANILLVPKPTDNTNQINEKHFLMSQQVTEYIEKARNLIANASEGVFPSTDNHEWVERSTRSRFD